MARAHFYRPVLDNQGNIVTNATVRVLEPGTTTPISETLYSGPSGEGSLANPFQPSNGVIDFYLGVARTVRLGITRGSQPEVFIENIDVGDPEDYKESFPFTLAGAISVQTGGLRFYIEDDCVVEKVRIALGVAPSGADAIIDLNKNGTTMFTNQANRPRVAIGANTGTAVPDVTGLVAGDYLTIDIDQVGSSTPGGDLVVTVRVRRIA